MEPTFSHPGEDPVPPQKSSQDGEPAPPDPEERALFHRLTHTLGVLVREVLQTILPAVVLALLLNHFVAQGTYVSGQSMEPNLHTNQRLIIEKVSYKLRPPERGEIVVVDVPHSEIPLIKRVVGLAGEALEIRNNQLYVDGQLLNEPYLTITYQRDFGPVLVPEGHVFVMGDNRNGSNDSRAFGPVPVDHIEGRAWVSYWPPEDIGMVN